MCGITGLFCKQGGADPSLVRAMARRLTHRGNDGSGEYFKDHVGIAHTRLAIIDLSTGQQPLFNEDRSICVVANGEIYNFMELRRQLEALDHRFATGSDCEVIVHAYESWGIQCLDQLHGMFAFALYDARKEELILARDRLGIKPLFLMERKDGIYFASQLKALLPAMGSPAIDPAGLIQFLQSDYSSGPTTVIKGITRLAPGETALIRNGQIESRYRYWKPRLGTLPSTTYSALFEQFDALIDAVMREHLRTDVPFGLFLSGGVDSSLLAMLIQRSTKEPLRTFSLGFPGTSAYNELAAARLTAHRIGAVHHEIEMTPDALLARLPLAVWAADELMGDRANLPASLLAERASSEVKVIFSGEGGDEVFAGYGRYRVPWWKGLLRQLSRPGSGGFRLRGSFSKWQDLLFEDSLKEVLHAWREPFLRAWRSGDRRWTLLQRMQALDMETQLPDQLLVKADRMLMAFGIEGRVPYLDHRIVEFGLALPDEFKVEGRTGKVFLRKWGEHFWPGEHLWTRKRGFSVPIGACLNDKTLSLLEKTLPYQPALRPWFKPKGVRDLFAQQRQNRKSSRAIWSLLQFAVWHTLFIDGDGVRPENNTSDLARYL